MISVIIDAVFAALQAEEVAANLAELKGDLRELDEKIKNLTLVSAQGGADIPSAISQLRDWQGTGRAAQRDRRRPSGAPDPP